MNNEIKISDEVKLLLCLARLTFSKDLVQKINDLILSVRDWPNFVYLANEHGISALVYHNLEKLDFLPLLPESAVKPLHNFLLKSTSRNAILKKAVADMLGQLNRAGIKVVLIKGFALEITVYNDGGLRQMTDVDILIERQYHIETRKILISNGYDSLPVKSMFHKPIIAWTGKHLPSLLKHGVSVDIHLELFGGGNSILTKQILDTAEKINIERETAYIPAPQLFFLFLVRHLNYHEIKIESQLRLYADLVILLEKYRKDILNNDLLSSASKAGLSEILAQKLEVLRDFMEVPLPEWLDDFINKGSNPDSIKKFVFFLQSPKNNKQASPGHLYRTTLKEIPGVHRKVLFILGDIFPYLSFMKERYRCKNSWKALLYYPLRVGKILYLFSR